jgi:hypothetical protein
VKLMVLQTLFWPWTPMEMPPWNSPGKANNRSATQETPRLSYSMKYVRI